MKKAFYENRVYADVPITAAIVRNMDFMAHWHHEVELLYVLEGKIRIGSHHQVEMLEEGDLALFGSSDIHFYDSSGLESQSIMVIFDPRLIGASSWPEGTTFKSPFIKKAYLERPEGNLEAKLRSLLGEILDEYREKAPHYVLVLKGKIMELCVLALRHFPLEAVGRAEHEKRYPYLKPIRSALKYLDQNYKDPITLESVSRMAGLSPFYFSRQFKSITNMNFKEYLLRVRVNQAEELIKSGLNVTEAAFESGFNSIRTFNRVFKAIKGYTPSSLR